jgi:hypothetical protein
MLIGAKSQRRLRRMTRSADPICRGGRLGVPNDSEVQSRARWLVRHDNAARLWNPPLYHADQG